MSEILGAYVILVDQVTYGYIKEEARAELGVPFEEIKLDGWYDNETTMNAYLSKVREKLFLKKKNLREIGKKIYPTLKIVTPDVLASTDDAVEFLKNINQGYISANRGEGVGEYIVENVTETTATFKENSPHLTDFVHGVVEGLFDVYSSHKLIRSKVVERKENGAPYSVIELKYKRV